MRRGGARVFLALAAGGVLAPLACNDLISLETPVDAGVADAITPVGAGDAEMPEPAEAGVADASSVPGTKVGPNGCPIGRGPTMSRLATDDGAYCIDTTEVSQAQYQSFLADSRERVRAGPCGDKASFTPGPATADPDGIGCGWDPALRAPFPVVCIDWCDAFSFCAWAGKRLCRQIGKDAGGPIDSSKAPAVNEWTRGCSQSGGNYFTYGSIPLELACNADGSDPYDAAAPVGSFLDCTHRDSGVFDMGANVQEWEDACEQSLPGRCRTRGADFHVAPKDTQCDREDKPDRLARAPRVGFRCCADVR